MSNLAFVMVTVDRSPQKNYIDQTLANLKRSGVDSLVSIADSGSPRSFVDHVLNLGSMCPSILIDIPSERRTANRNVATALRLGVETGKPWIIFLEDDIDVCGDFEGSVDRWLADHASEEWRVYPLGANYNFVRADRGPAALYRVDQFYGTQGFAIRREDAVSLAEYLERNEFALTGNGTAYDISMHHWMKETYPELSFFLTPAPSFVQHVGKESSIAPRPEAEIHTFPTFPGSTWSYEGKVAR